MSFPGAKLSFSIGHGELELITMFKRQPFLPGHNGGIIKHFENVTGLLRENDLLLCTFDDRGGVYIVGFLKLLPCDIRELRFRHQRLSFGADELLFEDWDFGRFRLLVLELLDFVLNLRCRESKWLNQGSLGTYSLSFSGYESVEHLTQCFESASAYLSSPLGSAQIDPPGRPPLPIKRQACR